MNIENKNIGILGLGVSGYWAAKLASSIGANVFVSDSKSDINEIYTKELTDMDIRQTMMREQQDALEQDMAPFGFVVTGLEDENIGEMVDEYGTKWSPIVRNYETDW